MEEDIDITLFGDEGEIEVELKARVDTALSISIVSKSLINRLRTKSQPSQGRSVRDSRGKLHAPIGRVDLLWHRKAVPKTNQQTFFVVDSSDEAVIFGANAVPPEDFPSIQPVGLGKQSEEAKKRQEQKRQEELAKRAKDKKDQEDREKRRQEQGRSGR